MTGGLGYWCVLGPYEEQEEREIFPFFPIPLYIQKAKGVTTNQYTKTAKSTQETMVNRREINPENWDIP